MESLLRALTYHISTAFARDSLALEDGIPNPASQKDRCESSGRHSWRSLEQCSVWVTEEGCPHATTICGE